jgi:hypothetical protein
MCDPGQQAGVAGLLAAVTDGLARLAALDMRALTTAEQADCLRILARAESLALAARSAVLAAFDADRGYEDDAAGGARSWLRWQTRATTAAAAGAVGWMRRLRAHPQVAAALATGTVSPSWARQVCDWTDPLDQGRDAGDQILLAAAAGGAQLADLAGLAEEMRARTAVPDTDPDGGGFGDRSLRLSEYWHGNGQLAGDLTPTAPPRCEPCWMRSAPRPAPKTCAARTSATTTPCTRRCSGSSLPAACPSAAASPPPSSCT